MDITRTLGSNRTDSGLCVFRVWAPYAKSVQLEIMPKSGPTSIREMIAEEDGYYCLSLDGIHIGDRYYYYFANNHYPDPASDFQPEGISGPSEVIERSLAQSWDGVSISDYIIYELHVGTYTTEGTFLAIIPHLHDLKDLGITAIELMPIAQFSGERNWGYDGVLPFAVQHSYGGPVALKTLIHACHQHGISVILDVVYNHLGPEGNVLDAFGPYFTNRYTTPWGKSLNFDGEYNHHVRRYFIENALHWFVEYGVDALRLDAVHAIIDVSAYSFLEELADKVRQLSVTTHRKLYLIAETDAADLRLIRPKEQCGYGMHALWNNDFYYALQTLLTQEKHSIYANFGTFSQVVKAYTEGFVYTGEYSPFHKKPYGISSKDTPSNQLVVFMQNHDQIGNREIGDRLSRRLSLDQLKFSASLLLCSPYIPLIFMGEEYGETAPFLYFIDHHDPHLIKAVRDGRAREFGLTENESPDPKSAQTFINSKLHHELKFEPAHQQLRQYYKTLLRIRKKEFNTRTYNKAMQTTFVDEEKLFLKITFVHQITSHASNTFAILANFSNTDYDYSSAFNPEGWTLLIASFDEKMANSRFANLPPYGFVLFKKGLVS